ncbi:hypothetical protein [Kitasatospora sp. NPDC059571]|uniref:hypothetical protein n=1 Tax=Kitasatospora sp. NPDC059571 TaxID=3346871 RepID=UPI00369FF960
MWEGRAQLGDDLFGGRVVERQGGLAPAEDRSSGFLRSGHEPCLLAALRISAHRERDGNSLWGLPAALARTGHLARAVELAYATDRRGEHDGLLPLLRAAIDAGDLHGAQALAGAMPDRALRDRALVALVPALARAGELDRAVALAECVRYPHNWGRTWALLAKAVADGGDLPAALGFAARAEASPGFVTEAGQVLVLLMEIATAAGDRARAEALADRVEDLARSEHGGRYDRALPRPFTAVLALEVRSGDPDRLDALLHILLRTVPDAPAAAKPPDGGEDGDGSREFECLLIRYRPAPRPPLGPAVLAELLNEVAGTVDRETALALADRGEALLRATVRAYSESLLEAVTLLLARHGQIERAMALTDWIGDPGRRAGRQAAAVGALARHDTVRAEALARALTDRWARLGALIEVVGEVARQGDPDRAEAIVGTIADRWARGQALIEVVREVARQGDPDRAEALARTIAYRSTRTRALAALVERAEPSRARRLAAQAALLGDRAFVRTFVLPHLERLVPGAVRAVADELMR